MSKDMDRSTSNSTHGAPNKSRFNFNFAPPPSMQKKLSNSDSVVQESLTSNTELKSSNKVPGPNFNFAPPPSMLKNLNNESNSKRESLGNSTSTTTVNKVPAFNFNFAPPPSLQRKQGGTDKSESSSCQTNTSNDSENINLNKVLKNMRPIDVARRLNFSHLSELEEYSKKQDEMSMVIDTNSDGDDEIIDLTQCIIPPEERAALLKMDEERRLRGPTPIVEIDIDDYDAPFTGLPVKEMKDLKITPIGRSRSPPRPNEPIVRSRSPPRPRLPCLFEDYDYCLEEQRRQCAEYKEKLKNQPVSGIAKVLSFEIPQLPVPEIDFWKLMRPSRPSHIKVFNFDTPSPDELYRLELEKNKNKVKKVMFLMP